MRETMKRMLALVLVLTIFLGLVGCSGPATTIPTGDVINNNTKPTGGNAGEEGGVGETGEVSYPLQTDHTLSIWCPSTTVPLYKGYESYKQSPWHIGLVEKTGVEVEWKYPVAGANNQQAYHLLMMNEELPDIISYNIDPGEAQLLYNEGVLVDLKEYLPKYAPDYWEFINSNEEYLRSVTTEDGQIFMFRQFIEDPEVAYGPVVRKDWLDECNLDIPKTIEDWEVMLKAFRQKYGAQFAFPYARFASGGLASGFGAYGATEGNFYLDNGQVKYSAVQPEHKEYLATLARWVKEGLLDVDSLTMTDEGFRTKAINDNCGAAFVVMSLYTKMLNDANAEMSNAEWIAVPYPVVEEGQPTNWVHMSTQVYQSGSFITTSCSEEKLITALKWLNYPYTDEGILYYNYGVENDTYIVDENGEVAFTDKVLKDKDSVATACLKYTGMGNVSIAGIHLSHFTKIKNDPIVAEGAAVWIENTEAAEHKLPVIVMTAKEASRYSNLSNAVNTYCAEMSMKFIAGDVDISEWDSAVDYMYSLGLQELLDIQNAAYQRYLNQK